MAMGATIDKETDDAALSATQTTAKTSSVSGSLKHGSKSESFDSNTDKAAADGKKLADDEYDDEDEGGARGGGGGGHKMRTGQGWGKGIVADVRRTICTHWRGEMVNFNGKVRRVNVAFYTL